MKSNDTTQLAARALVLGRDITARVRVMQLLNVNSRKRPNKEFLPNPNRTSDFILPNRTGQKQPNPEPNRNFGRFLVNSMMKIKTHIDAL